MRKYTPFLLALLCLLLIGSCQKESIAPTAEVVDETQFLQLNTIEDLERFEKEWQANTGTSRHSNFGKTIILKANSNNALQDAVNAAGRFGRVILEKGNHIQETTVTISHPVFIIGEEGARLTTNVPAQIGQGVVQTAFHIYEGNRVVIWGLEMINRVEGGAAFIIEDAQRAVIAKTNMYNYQTGVIIQQGDKSLIWKNNIQLTPKSLAFEFFVAYGIVNINGDAVKITANKVTNGVFGIWACDKNGEARFNETFNNFIGFILCNVPPNDIALESGSAVGGSEEPGNRWQVTNNHSHDNFDAGYLVVDGANNNFLIDNRGGNNGTFDIDLTTDTERFGFPVPGSFENFVDAGSFDNISIKDCGENNLVIGGQQVDTSVDACF